MKIDKMQSVFCRLNQTKSNLKLALFLNNPGLLEIMRRFHTRRHPQTLKPYGGLRQIGNSTPLGLGVTKTDVQTMR